MPVLWADHCHSIVSTINPRCKIKKYVGLGHEVNSAVQHDLEMFLRSLYINHRQ